jgi:hypothetical protein
MHAQLGFVALALLAGRRARAGRTALREHGAGGVVADLAELLETR